MAEARVTPPAELGGDHTELDEQIESLLRDAEARLGSQSAVTHTHVSKNIQIKLPMLETHELPRPYVLSDRGVARADHTRLVKPQERQSANGLRRVEDPVVLKETLKKAKKATTGPNWFDLPRTKITPELKRDLQLLQMRSVLDPKRHYKKDGASRKKAMPEYCQVGTVVEGPTEFLSSRIPNKERKKTFVEEVLANAESRKRFKKKYSELQSARESGGKLYYRQLKAKRSKNRR